MEGDMKAIHDDASFEILSCTKENLKWGDSEQEIGEEITDKKSFVCEYKIESQKRHRKCDFVPLSAIQASEEDPSSEPLELAPYDWISNDCQTFPRKNLNSPEFGQECLNAVVEREQPVFSNPFSKLRDWFKGTKFFQTVIQEAQISLTNLTQSLKVQDDINLGIDYVSEVTIIADSENEFTVLRDAFMDVFQGQLYVHCLDAGTGRCPVLPVGFAAGLRAAEAKIQYLKENQHLGWNDIAVSISPLLIETTLQRWQSTAVITLEDPNLPLNLHNYTQMTPVPNVYVTEAEHCTPESYFLRHEGFSVSIAEVMDTNTSLGELKDCVKHLTDVSSNSMLKLAARSLAGMYKKYLCGFSK